MVSESNKETAPSRLFVKGLEVRHGFFQAVHGVDISVAAGEVVSIIGANGAGKSSLLTALMGAVTVSAGSVQWREQEIANAATADIIKSGIALVPEGRRLFATLTVDENLNIGQSTGRPGPIDKDTVFTWFPALREHRFRKAGELSGGQQQMVALGRAMLANPEILLCDEISLGLAPTIVKDMYKVLLDLRDTGVGIILVEQDITRSLDVADRFYCMLEGRITLEGNPGDVDRDTVARHYFGTHTEEEQT